MRRTAILAVGLALLAAAALLVPARRPVRLEVGGFDDGQPAGKVLVTRGPWAAHSVEFPSSFATGGLDVALALRPLPLVRGAHVDNPQLLLDYAEVEAEGGWRLSWPAIAVLAVMTAAIALFAASIGLSTPAVIAVGTAAAALIV